MKLIRFLLPPIFFLCCVSLWATEGEGYYLEERISHPAMMGQPARDEVVKTWVLGDEMMRKDTKEGTETILFRMDDNTIQVLNHQSKEYIEIPGERFRQMALIGFNMFTTTDGSGETKVPEVLFKKTGETRKIGKWDCYEVAVQGSGMMGSESTQWIATNTGFDSKIYRKIFAFLFGGELPEQYQPILDRISELDGYPVQTVTKIDFGGEKVTTTNTLVKIEKKPLAKDWFALPEGYVKKELNLPPLPTQ